MVSSFRHYAANILGATLLFAQAPPEDPGLVLRSTTRLVQVNVVVQDKNGQPVSDLAKEDFVVKDDGKAQVIRAFSLESSDRVLEPATKLAPNVFSNRIEQRSGAPGSVTVILLDGLNTRWGDQMTAAKQVADFLKQVQPGERVALYGLSRELRILHDYTTDFQSLLKALEKFHGLQTSVLGAAEAGVSSELNATGLRLGASGELGSSEADKQHQEAVRGLLDLLEEERNFNQETRIKNSLKALEAISNHLASIPGRKSVVWVSAAFPTAIGFTPEVSAGTPMYASDLAGARRRPGGLSRTVRANTGGIQHPFGRGPRTFGDEMQRAIRAMNNANLAIYPVDARGLSVDPSVSINTSTMSQLAKGTGGKAYYNTNDLKNSIRGAIEDAKVTYTLAYYPNELTGDGRFRDIKVQVKRSGLVLRHRRGYYDLPEAPAHDEKVREAAMRDALWSPLDATGVKVDARVQFADQPQKTLQVQVLVDGASITFNQQNGRWLAKTDVLFMQTDDKGTDHEVSSKTLNLDLDTEAHRKTVKTGAVYRSIVQRHEKATKLRIVVCDRESGSVGSLTIPLGKVAQDLGSSGQAPKVAF